MDKNGFSDKIEIIHGLCGTKNENIKTKIIGSGGRTRITSKGTDTSIESFNISYFVKKYNITDGILKIDCEGCEYDIILNCPSEVLNKFSQIILEFHHGYQNIKEKLEKSGFFVTWTKPRYTFDGKYFQGILLAVLSNKNNI